MTNRLRRMTGFGVFGGLVTASLLLTGCGGGGGGSNIDLANVTVHTGSDDATKANSTTEQVIEVKDGSFSPDSVTIKPGTKVIWKWTANVSCSLLLSGTAAPEQSSGTYERLFSTGGSTFSYQCAGKPEMAGKITVE